MIIFLLFLLLMDPLFSPYKVKELLKMLMLQHKDTTYHNW